MKRVWIAAGVLLLIVVLSIGSQLWIASVMNTMESSLDNIQEAVDARRYEQANAHTLELMDYYKEKAPFLTLFIKQDVISATFSALGGLTAYAEEESEPDLHCEADKARAQINAIRLLFAV